MRPSIPGSLFTPLREFLRSRRSILLPAGIMVGFGALVLALASLAEPDRSDDGQPAAESARFTPDALDRLLQPVRDEIALGAFPGAAVAVGVRDREVHEIGLGRIGWREDAPLVDPDSTIYDLASLTKVIATVTAIMLLVDDGKLALDDPVSRYLPAFADGPKSAVTIRHLLTHTSGLPEGAELRGGSSRVERIALAATFPIYPPAGARVEYSDIGFVLAGEIAERAAGEPLPAFLRRRLYGPLGMQSTRFLPGLDCERCAPTGRLRDQSLYRGKPFDPLAQRLDGIGGSAGLFSTAHDMGIFAAMIANGGEVGGVRVLSPEAIREFTGPQPVGGRYRLGWETMCAMDIPEGIPCTNTIAIGHTGWTGTSIWIDLESGVWTVLLTNRTYEPRAPNRLQRIRRELFARATGRSPPTAGDATSPGAGSLIAREAD